MPLLSARALALGQIAAGLNFFGIGPDYVPPFSFEYLQNTARYFAQHAAQVEQRYIQFKSTGENEELRREQMDQQAELARPRSSSSSRGLAEAQAGVEVARPSLNYADVQRDNAQQIADRLRRRALGAARARRPAGLGRRRRAGPDDESSSTIIRLPTTAPTASRAATSL